MGKFKALLPWALAFVGAWSLGLVYNLHVGGESYFLARMYRQKMAIAAERKAPRRLLLIGGSGVHHAFNSAYLEQKLGIPVINMGLDGPIGLNLILPSVLKAVQPGDIVLFVPENTLLTSPNGILERSVAFGAAIGKPGLGDIPIKQFFADGWMLGVPTFRGAVKSAIDLAQRGQFWGYYADPITSHGDPTVVKPRFSEWWSWKFDDQITRHAFDRITRFRREVEAKGATLVLALPWVYAKPTPQNLAYVKNTTQALSAIAPTLYDPKTYNLQQDFGYFADTHYHLQPHARQLHSEQIFRELQPILKQLSTTP
jgi:hypothetical protein